MTTGIEVSANRDLAYFIEMKRGRKVLEGTLRKTPNKYKTRLSPLEVRSSV